MNFAKSEESKKAGINVGIGIKEIFMENKGGYGQQFKKSNVWTGTNTTYRKSRFQVKRPIRSFLDLEVYQRTARAATEIITKLIPSFTQQDKGPESIDCPVKERLIESSLKIPEIISQAHSRRFEKGDELKILENALEECNKVVVYLEQIRDIFGQKVDRALCEDLIKRYILARRKIFNLYKAWRRFAEEKASKGAISETRKG